MADGDDTARGIPRIHTHAYTYTLHAYISSVTDLSTGTVGWFHAWAPSLGDRHFFADQDFSVTVFPENISISRRKFLMTFFSHRPGFSDFTFLYCIKCRIRPFLH